MDWELSHLIKFDSAHRLLCLYRLHTDRRHYLLSDSVSYQWTLPPLLHGQQILLALANPQRPILKDTISLQLLQHKMIDDLLIISYTPNHTLLTSFLGIIGNNRLNPLIYLLVQFGNLLNRLALRREILLHIPLLITVLALLRGADRLFLVVADVYVSEGASERGCWSVRDLGSVCSVGLLVSRGLLASLLGVGGAGGLASSVVLSGWSLLARNRVLAVEFLQLLLELLGFLNERFLLLGWARLEPTLIAFLWSILNRLFDRLFPFIESSPIES